MEVNSHEAKTHFSRLLQRVARGEEVTIARAGVPVARLVPVESRKKIRPLGMDRGKIWIADDLRLAGGGGPRQNRERLEHQT